MPKWLEQKSQLFIESDVEGDWVHQIKQLQVDKGKGQMEMADLDPDEEEAQCKVFTLYQGSHRSQ